MRDGKHLAPGDRMAEPESLPPDYYCPNPDVDCPGRGPDLTEIREVIKDADGEVLGYLVFMECRKCGYRWDQS
jgi:hypothetical protein